jgi:8-oxo-dGTP pyrophosphatase MutT (NUDIX family)
MQVREDWVELERADVVRRLAEFRSIPSSRTDLKPASVALCIVIYEGVPSLVITRRSAGLRSHAGQWALPGGRRDQGESVVDPGRRELLEETSLQVAPDDVLGVLDDYVTRSGYVMSPVVMWGGITDGALKGAESEVAQIHIVPLADLDVEPRFLSIPESEFPVIQLPLLGRHIHAPTAAILYQFCQVVLRRQPTRVSHFEQPVFAWK